MSKWVATRNTKSWATRNQEIISEANNKIQVSMLSETKMKRNNKSKNQLLIQSGVPRTKWLNQEKVINSSKYEIGMKI